MMGLIVLVMAMSLAGRLAEGRVGRDLALEAAQSAALFDALLASEVERYRALPLTLATDLEVRSALVRADPQARARLGRRLELLAGTLGAATIYVIGADGITVAASNAGSPDSFVGQDYRFRSYFRGAMEKGAADQFALGSISRRPGLYLAQRVGGAAAPLGVLVVKAEFLSVEEDWRRSRKPAFVADGSGRILITSVGDWRFRMADSVLQPFPASGGQVTLALPGSDYRSGFQVARRETIVPGWTLTVLAPRDSRVAEAAFAARALVLLALGTALAGGVLLWRRLRRQRREEQAALAARIDLEAKVADRTAALSDVNHKLMAEIAERKRIEEEARLLHQELEQANRLATLGQIAAGVTHEINQPVAAIRASADNAKTLLDREDVQSARTAIGTIVRLTERIGNITRELRGFATKVPDQAKLMMLDTAIDGALLLVGPSVQAQAVAIRRGRRRPDLKVLADRVRVEQILVNLLQNGIDALAQAEQREIHVILQQTGELVEILVADSGPGICQDIASALFTPFRTSKPHGLGLGLVISRDIATALGGELDLLPSVDGRAGATFRLRLPKAA